MGRLALTLSRIGLSSIRIALLALSLPSFGIAATITVTDSDDVVFAGDGLCSLREALGNANDNAATYSDCAAGSAATPDNIVLDFGTPTTIVLTANLPTVTGDTVISGSFSNPVTIDGNGQFRHFVIDNGNNSTYSEVTIEFLTLVNGHDAGPGGSIRNYEDLNLERVDFINNHASDAGGAVQSETGSLYVFECEFIDNGVDAAVGSGIGGAVQVNSGLAWLGVERSRFQGNTAALAGGAIQSAANTFYLTLSTFSGNTAQGSNGGAVVANGNGLTVETSSFDGNSAVNRGGGLYFNGATVVVRKSTFSTNTAQYGSALSIAGSAQLTMENATVSGNGANNGGAGALTTFNTSTATVTASSFVQNTAPNGGRAFHAGNTSSISVFTSIISLSNLAAPLCGGLGTVTTDAFSVASNGTCGLAADMGSPLVNQMLPLADNGGPVPTHALLPSSPAIDWAADCKGITEDGRGFSRPIDGGSGSATCDAGAYEFSQMIVNTLDDGVAPDGLCSLREALNNANFDLNTFADCGPGRGRDRIVFDVTPNGTIMLAGVGLSISDSVTLVGSTSTQVSIDAGGAVRHFLVNDSNPDHQIEVSMDALRLVNGLAADGGAIQSFEDLSIDQMVFENNTANGDNRYGGALSMRAGDLQVTRSSFLGNHANGLAGSGGALAALPGTTVFIATSQFLDNTAVGGGGGVYLAGVDPATLQRITFARNQSGSPGGALTIAGASAASGKNLTFSANQGPGQGGAVAVLGGSATALIDHSTFFGNVSGGGSNALRLASGAVVTLSDSLMEDGDLAGPQCSNSGSTLNLAGTNLVDDASCGVAATSSASIGLDPGLLANGGTNQTHALVEGSVAIDAGTDCAGTGIDQRGYSRSRDGDLDGSVSCDVGAYEFTPIIVTTVADVLNGGDGECSLREAIANANNNRLLYGSCEPGGGPDLIAFDLPSPSTIVLGGVLPQIETPMAIRGPGRDQLTVDANGAGRHFIVSNADPSLIDVSLSGMTLSNALASGAGGSLISQESLVLRDMRFSNNEATTNPGGAVSINGGSVSISNCEFSGNTASNASNGRGGALRVAIGTSADIVDSQFMGNDAATFGGAIAVDDGGVLTGSGLLFSGNHADADGGALDVDGATATGELAATRFTGNTSVAFGGGLSVREGADLSLHRVTLDANHTDGIGGGASVRLNSTLDAENSTFSGNTAGNQGGGLYAGAPLTLVALTGSTFSGNDAANLGEALRSSQATIGLVNSLLEDNDVAGDLCSGANGASITANAGTIADDASCSGVTVGSSLNLGPLTDYGFIAPSHGLLPWSDAVDATADCAGLVIDQRGESRPSGAGCDAGSFEVHNIAPQTKGEMFISGETQNVAGLNLLANELDPDNTGTMEVERVGYTDVNGQPQILNISGVHLNPFTIQPGVTVYVARNGQLAFSPGSALLYLRPGETLDVGVNYIVSDGYSEAGTSFTLRFNGEETPPVLANDTKTVAMDSAGTTIDVLANDTDVDGGTNTITAVTQPANGTVVIAGDSLSLTYQPDASYCNGGMPTDDFTYTVNGLLTANVAVTVSCGPVGIDLSIGISGDAVASPDSAVGYQVLAQNIGDVDGMASINVLFDARLSGVSWTCTLTPGGACGSGTGDISSDVLLPIGAQVQFDVSATAPASASNTPLSISAAVNAVGDTDVDMTNNVASFETETAMFLDGFEDASP